MKIEIIFVAVFVGQLCLVSYGSGMDLPADFCANKTNNVYPHPNDCTKFVICMNEMPLVNACPNPNEVFHEGFCVEGDPVTCEVFGLTTTEPVSTTEPITTTERVTTTEDTTTTTQMGLPDDFCKNNPIGLLPHPYNCTQYVICMEGTPVIKSCTFPNIIFNNGSCTAGDPITCEIFELSTTTDPISTTEPITTSRPPTTVPIPVHRCPPSGFGLIPNYTNCSRYFECIAGIRHMRFCPDGLLFDSVTLECTTPELAVCAGGN